MNIDRGLQWYSRLLNLALKNVEEDEGTGKSLFYFCRQFNINQFSQTLRLIQISSSRKTVLGLLFLLTDTDDTFASITLVIQNAFRIVEGR
jgi:hypothetical protein